MFVVTNRITVKKVLQKMAPRFTKGGKIEALQGFHKIEVWKVTRDHENEDMYVNTWWETEKTLKLGLKAMHLKKHIKTETKHRLNLHR